jgi:hypothetical protein
VSELAHQFEEFAPRPPPASQRPSADHQPRGVGRAGLVLPLVIAVLLVATAGWFVAKGRSASEQVAPIQAQTNRLTAARQLVEVRVARAADVAAQVDSAINAVVPAVDKVKASREAQIDSQRAVVDAADAAVEQLNSGDMAGGLNAFGTTVTAAVDANAVALAAERADFGAVVAALRGVAEAQKVKL